MRVATGIDALLNRISDYVVWLYVQKNWDELVHTHHCATDFYESYAGWNPRRACEDVLSRTVDLVWTE